MELRKRPETDLDDLLRTKLDRVLCLKCLHKSEFSDIQSRIFNIIARHRDILSLETVSRESFINILNTRTTFSEKLLPLVISQIASSIDDTEEGVERVADLLCAIINNCDETISEEVLTGVEKSLANEFLRDLLLNSLVVKICK